MCCDERETAGEMRDLLAQFSQQLLTNPYPAYHVIRRLDPVHWSESWQAWFITRHRDVATLMKDPGLSVSQVAIFSRRLAEADDTPETRAKLQQIEAWLGRFLLFTDPPAHTRLRALISKAFTPRSVETLAPLVQERVDQLLAGLAAGEQVDLLQHIAVPLPVMTIADFLGSRPDDYHELQGWSHDLASFLGNDLLTAADVDRSLVSLNGMANYFMGLMEERRLRPQEDLMSRLLQAQHEGSALSEDEILALCVLLFGAGHDTTTNLIANGLLALLQHPSEIQKVLADPAVMERASEEVLRYDGPSLVASRVALADFELDGRSIRQGDSLNLCMGAANRDPLQFEQPDRFLVQRDNTGHVAFGKGIHFCVGSFLAKLEARTVYRAVLQKWPGTKVLGVPERIPTLAFRRLKSLNVELRA